MANNTTWNFTGLPSGSTIMSYSPQIPGVNFALVNSDGVHTLLNAGGAPTQAGSFTTTLRVGTSACYKDVQVSMNVTQAAQPSCAVALANGTRKYGLNVGLTPTYANFSIIDGMSLDVTPSEYGTFSYSYVSGQQIPGLSMVAVPRAATWWSTDPAKAYIPVTLDAATIASLRGQTFQAVWRVTFTASATGCQSHLDFPVEFRVYDATPNYSGGGNGA